MKAIKYLYFLICSVFLLSQTVLAYIDPASGTYIIQILAGVFIAGGAAIGIYWHKIKLFFRNRKDKNEKK